MGALRSFASSTIRLGSIEIPVKLYAAVGDEEGVKLHGVHAICGERLKQTTECPECGEIDENEKAKGYEIPGTKRCLVLSADDVAQIFEREDPAIEIECFTDASPSLPYEKIYYLGTHDVSDRGYALLVRMLSKRKDVIAFGRSKRSGREHLAELVAVDHRLVLRHFAYPAAVRPLEDVPGSQATINPKEMKLANLLIDRMWVDRIDTTGLADESKKRVAELLREKALGRAIPVAEKIARPGAPIVDLGEALERMLSQPSKALRSR